MDKTKARRGFLSFKGIPLVTALGYSSFSHSQCFTSVCTANNLHFVISISNLVKIY